MRTTLLADGTDRGRTGLLGPTVTAGLVGVTVTFLLVASWCYTSYAGTDVGAQAGVTLGAALCFVAAPLLLLHRRPERAWGTDTAVVGALITGIVVLTTETPRLLTHGPEDYQPPTDLLVLGCAVVGLASVLLDAARPEHLPRWRQLAAVGLVGLAVVHLLVVAEVAAGLPDATGLVPLWRGEEVLGLGAAVLGVALLLAAPWLTGLLAAGFGVVTTVVRVVMPMDQGETMTGLGPWTSTAERDDISLLVVLAAAVTLVVAGSAQFVRGLPADPAAPAPPPPPPPPTP